MNSKLWYTDLYGKGKRGFKVNKFGVTQAPAVGGLIGDRQFYKKVFLVAVPIMVQNGITNFVGLLDNVMVGQVGTEQMSGVAIANQLIFIFNLCIFGAVAGAGILGAQFYGSGNQEGIKYTLRFKIIGGLMLTAAFTGIFLLRGDLLIQLFLHQGEGGGDLEATLGFGMKYLRIMVIGLLPFAITQAYSGTLRETGQTVVPMTAGIIAVLVNLVFNYILIFGKFGAPALGVAGAAIATVLSRFVELAIVAGWTHRNAEKNVFIKGALRSLHIPAPLIKQIMIVGLPLFINEVLWSCGMTFMNQCYSVRGLEVVAALNIAMTIGNLFNVVFLSLGNAVGIIIGQLLGAGKLEQAKFSVFCCLITGSMMILVSPFFPLLYNTEVMVKELATQMIFILGCCQPIFGFVHATYFTLRAGGKSIVTFLFDSAYMWVISIPIVFVLSRFTTVPVQMVLLFAQLSDLLKCGVGFVLVKKGVWIKNIVSEKNE